MDAEYYWEGKVASSRQEQNGTGPHARQASLQTDVVGTTRWPLVRLVEVDGAGGARSDAEARRGRP